MTDGSSQQRPSSRDLHGDVEGSSARQRDRETEMGAEEGGRGKKDHTKRYVSQRSFFWLLNNADIGNKTDNHNENDRGHEPTAFLLLRLPEIEVVAS